ncbi:MAG: hypothetical protein ABJD07_05995, partial [Gemmatimonadaceae bacterium]
VIAGIPDFRQPAPASSVVEAEYDRAARLYEDTRDRDIRDVVSRAFSTRLGWSERIAELRTEQPLAQPGRLRREIYGWLEVAVPKAEGQFLDLGCGMGGLLSGSALEGRPSIGIDNRIEILVVAKRTIEAHGGTATLAPRTVRHCRLATTPTMAWSCTR